MIIPEIMFKLINYTLLMGSDKNLGDSRVKAFSRFTIRSLNHNVEILAFSAT